MTWLNYSFGFDANIFSTWKRRDLPFSVNFFLGIHWSGVGKCPMTWEYWTSPKIVAIIDHIPNGWVMFNGDMTNDPCWSMDFRRISRSAYGTSLSFSTFSMTSFPTPKQMCLAGSSRGPTSTSWWKQMEKFSSSSWQDINGSNKSSNTLW